MTLQCVSFQCGPEFWAMMRPCIHSSFLPLSHTCGWPDAWQRTMITFHTAMLHSHQIHTRSHRNTPRRATQVKTWSFSSEQGGVLNIWRVFECQHSGTAIPAAASSCRGNLASLRTKMVANNWASSVTVVMLLIMTRVCVCVCVGMLKCNAENRLKVHWSR